MPADRRCDPMTPQEAGYTTEEALRRAIKEYPHMRPCAWKKCWWVYRTRCEDCDPSVGPQPKKRKRR